MTQLGFIRQLSAVALTGALFVGCGSDTAEEDATLNLTGTESAALKTTDDNGNIVYVCPSPKKELVCHIPPGNPANAHTICVSHKAVDTHVTHHGDTIGPCETPDGGTGTGDDPDAGTGGDLDAGPACAAEGEACTTGAECCSQSCTNDVCSPIIIN